MAFYAYIARCRDGTLYAGWTDGLEKRLSAHNAGKGGRYTRSRRPVTLVYAEEFSTKNEAMSRERAIKRMTRAEKLLLTDKTAPDTEPRPWGSAPDPAQGPRPLARENTV
jgi:putative endonuclease